MGQSVYGGTGDQSQYGSNYNSGSGTTYTASGSGSSQYGSDYVTPQQYDEAIARQKEVLRSMAGGATQFERQQEQSKLDDLQKARDNAYRIAKMEDDTRRYGYNQERQTEIDKLKENARQYDKTHELDVKKQDLSEAQYISDQRSQPNRLFQTMDLEQALGSIRSGNHATTSTNVAAVDGLSTDYNDNPYMKNSGGSSSNGGSSSGGTTYTASGSGTDSGGTVTATGSQQTTSTTDPRVKAVKAVIDALPPSATEGLDSNAVAALNAAYSLYSSALHPGTLESLSPTQKETLKSASQRIQKYTGQSYDDLVANYNKWGVGQKSANAA